MMNIDNFTFAYEEDNVCAENEFLALCSRITFNDLGSVKQHLSTEQLSFQHTSMEQLPFQHLSTEQLPFQHLSFEQLPFQQLPFQHLSTEQLPFQHTSMEEFRFQHTSLEQLPFQHLSMEHLSMEHLSMEHLSMEDPPAQSVLTTSLGGKGCLREDPFKKVAQLYEVALEVGQRCGIRHEHYEDITTLVKETVRKILSKKRTEKRKLKVLEMSMKLKLQMAEDSIRNRSLSAAFFEYDVLLSIATKRRRGNK